ncbi:MAG TPA: class I SAM-dependent methyltransferase [Solirubrobacteraceae bacterium]
MALAQFVREYRTVRRAEGWGSVDSAYYAALPYRDLSGRYPEIWRIRARSYSVFLSRVLRPLEAQTERLTILDLGAGNAWLSARLVRRGHRAIAVDVLDDPLDGLRAVRHYLDRHKPAPVLGEFDHLPLPAQTVDLAIFNASLHYSTDYARTLRETLQVLRQSGTLVILDSPMYSDPTSGQRMVQEREARFLRTYGFASNALDCEHFLTPAQLTALSRALGLSWRVHAPRLDPLTAVRRQLDGVRARREPARFPVIVGTRA